jgi:hypothetical protein
MNPLTGTWSVAGAPQFGQRPGFTAGRGAGASVSTMRGPSSLI